MELLDGTSRRNRSVKPGARGGSAPASCAFHAEAISAGISNGAYFHSSASRVRAISSLPSGAPWLDSLPALLGDPNPIVVRQQISTGFSDLSAVWIAVSISIGSWPLTLRTTVQP